MHSHWKTACCGWPPLLLLLILLLSHVSFCTTACNGPGCHRQRTRSSSSPSTQQLPSWFSEDLKPVIREHPVSQTTRQSEKVILKCRVSTPANVNLTFSWFKDDKKVELTESKNHASTWMEGGNETGHGDSGPRGRHDQVNSLHLEDFEDGEQGLYQCVVHSRFGSVESKKARITLLTVPLFVRHPSDTIVRAGETARFECAAKGEPHPQISWSKKDETTFLAATERRMQLMPQDSSIFIVAVRAEDEGIYTCKAENEAGVSTASAKLEVIEVPRFLKPMLDKGVIGGEKAVLECLATGAPKPNLIWTKDGSPIRLTKRHFLTADNQLLIIVQANQSDSGRYACQISNHLGSVKQSLVLQVNQPPFYQPLVDNWTSVTAYFFIVIAILIVMFAIQQFKSGSAPAHDKDSLPDQDSSSSSFAPGHTTILTDLDADTSITMTPDVDFDQLSIDRDIIPYHLDIGR